MQISRCDPWLVHEKVFSPSRQTIPSLSRSSQLVVVVWIVIMITAYDKGVYFKKCCIVPWFSHDQLLILVSDISPNSTFSAWFVNTHFSYLFHNLWRHSVLDTTFCNRNVPLASSFLLRSGLSRSCLLCVVDKWLGLSSRWYAVSCAQPLEISPTPQHGVLFLLSAQPSTFVAAF